MKLTAIITEPIYAHTYFDELGKEYRLRFNNEPTDRVRMFGNIYTKTRLQVELKFKSK